MQTSSALAAFLSDQTRHERLQVAGQACRGKWLCQSAIVALGDRLQALSDTPPDNFADFAAALVDWASDHQWVDDLLALMLTEMGCDDFAVLPWQPQNTSVLKGISVLQKGQSNCTLTLVDADQLDMHPSNQLVFDTGFNLLAIVGGGPLLTELYRRNPDKTPGNTMVTLAERRWLIPGEQIALDCAHEQLRLVEARSDTVLLRFALSTGDAGARVTEYDIATGRALRTGCGDVSTSRMLALLSVAADGDDAQLLPVLNALTRHEDSLLRWQSMRMLVARTGLSALPILDEMAENDCDLAVRSVARQTQALLAQVQLAQPQLAKTDGERLAENVG